MAATPHSWCRSDMEAASGPARLVAVDRLRAKSVLPARRRRFKARAFGPIPFYGQPAWHSTAAKPASICGISCDWCANFNHLTPFKLDESRPGCRHALVEQVALIRVEPDQRIPLLPQP